jgi:hypothetical protein
MFAEASSTISVNTSSVEEKSYSTIKAERLQTK